MEDAGDVGGVGDDDDDAHPAAALATEGHVDGEDAGEEIGTDFDLNICRAPVVDDWKYSDALESWVGPYGWDYDEVWVDHLLDLRAGTYEIWINNPGRMNLFDKPMSLRRM